MSAPLLGPSGTRNFTVRRGQDWAEGWACDSVANDMKAARTMNALACAHIFILCMALIPAGCGSLHATASSLTTFLSRHPPMTGSQVEIAARARDWQERTL